MTKKGEDYSAYMNLGHNSQADIPEITKLAEAQFAAQERVSKLEEELTEAKENLRNYSEKLLPEAMDKMGIDSYGTKTGIRVEVKEKIRGGLAVENRPKGHQWLEDNGFGALIESEVIISFTRKQLDEAHKLVEQLRDEKKPAILERNVHHARLDGFIREQLAQGKELPLDIFTVFRQRIAKVET